MSIDGAGYSNLLNSSASPTVTFSSLISGYSPTQPTTVVYATDADGSYSSTSFIYRGAGFPTQAVANSPSGSTGTFFQVVGGGTGTGVANLSFTVKPSAVYVRDVYYGTGYHEYGAF